MGLLRLLLIRFASRSRLSSPFGTVLRVPAANTDFAWLMSAITSHVSSGTDAPTLESSGLSSERDSERAIPDQASILPAV